MVIFITSKEFRNDFVTVFQWKNGDDYYYQVESTTKDKRILKTFQKLEIPNIENIFSKTFVFKTDKDIMGLIKKEFSS
ncbi:MAG: hypothetical protein BWY04_01053 [candidate division CPR1 bacterium ADurb.Bin160]|uniref:Uncharacterized protein n=1 Tax=candidate division CPR1 bacterium ADurb.Bin160 TaxID=1852826 RepID=A0A1V5ZLF9_9BACT|nr:MAG: hypothetical protein BWY04_01053 [candidate division CPR1 bacterium ADurb.Bin160]